MRGILAVGVCFLVGGCAGYPAAPPGRPFGYHLVVNLTVPSGERRKIAGFAPVEVDCSSVGTPEATAVAGPSHGAITTEKGMDFPRYALDLARSKCIRPSPATLIFYQSAAGYSGMDRVVVRLVFADGGTRDVEYALTVR